MPKIYQEKPESEELYLDLWQDGKFVQLRLLTEAGEWYCTLATISDAGLKAEAAIDMNIAARAGIALDANGRLKVIGQEVVAAERMQSHSYKCDHSDNDALRVEIAPSHARIAIGLVVDGLCTTNVLLNAKQIRTLADTLNRHLAYLEQEGLDKP